MAIEKFRFVSPGVQVNEIDDSIIQPAPPAIGPVVIGNTAKGPAMQPVQVSSVAELERVFGAPSNGNVGSIDVWRTGVPTSPTLATYAAKAFLANSSPVTVMRLAGVAVDTQSVSAKGGWSVDSVYQLYGVVNNNTGSLLANIYSNVAVSLSGSDVSGTVGITGSTATITIDGVDHKFSMDPNKKHFIRNVLNTNPTNINGSENYFLGETFENSTGSIVGYDRFFLQEVTDTNFTTFQEEKGSTPAISPMVISELVSGTYDQYTDLFYFEGLNSGASLSKDIKISIENVKPSRNVAVTKYGTFDVVVRKLFESATQSVLERFSGVTLDPNSDNYIVKRIGDMKRSWDFSEKRYIEEGMYSNKSAYVRIVMAASDISPFALPAGFRLFEPPTISIESSNNEDLYSGSVFYPEIELLDQAKLSSAKSKRFGLVSDSVENADVVDLLCYKGLAGYLDPNDNLNYKIFHTDFISSSATDLIYVQDTYCDQKLLTSGSFAGFDIPMYGGFDAKDITQKESFVNNDILASGNELNNPAYRAIKQAIEMVAEPEFIDMNTLVVPGLQNEELTNLMLEVCKTRGDAQAIIDLPGDYLYSYENNDPNFKISVLNVTTQVQERAFDNSYGAAYFPAVFVPTEGIFMPASIAALGAIGGTEGRSALWFAPAGFNRGGLTQANSGISVSRTALHLTSADRDALYENNINPIATFPNEGVVIFGQKTLQTTPSALDRVNVRRLVNYIKKQISRVATRVLFEPNVENTWNSFKSVVDPFLLQIKNLYGLDDAKVVLDSSTTTADLVDRNIMYCKIYLKPTRAIEYIAIDFVVTNSGSSFAE